MIAVVLQGGLGNQMFQYAAGRSLAAARGTELILSTAALSSRWRSRTSRAYELAGFRISASLCSAAEEREIALATRLGKFSRLLTPWNVYTEQGTGFDRRLLDAPSDTVLRGYWQSDRYFHRHAKTVTHELTPLKPLPPRLEAWREKMASGPSVSVHVRRGDYVTLAAAANLHGVLPLTYYQRAIDRIRQIESSPVCYVFTDDPAWCRSNLVLDGCELHHPSAELASVGMHDLMLMRSCRHHIVANSSFSWWSAWLADADRPGNGVAIAPRRWFAGSDDKTATEDRFPSNWELL